MLTSYVYFILFKYNKTNNTLHLVFANENEKSNYISISSPITSLKNTNLDEYEIVTKSDSHYTAKINKEIFTKYYNELEIMTQLMKN